MGGGELAGLLITLFVFAAFCAMSLVFFAVSLTVVLAPLTFLIVTLPKALEQASKRTRQRRRVWAEVAVELGLRFEDYELRGTVHGLGVRVWLRTVRTRNTTSTHTICEVTGLPAGLRLGRDSVVSRALGSADLQVGDPAFDERFRILGEPAVIGFFDAPVRERIAASDATLSIERGTLRASVSGHLHERDPLMALLTDALDTARRIAGEPPLPERLVTGARTDPVPSVRARMLEALLSGWPDRGEPLLPEALAAPEPEVRLVAARHTGSAAGLLSVLDDPAADVATRTAAITALAGADDDELVGRGLRAALETPDAAPLWHAALDVVRERRPPGSLRALLALAEEVRPDNWGEGNRMRRYGHAAEQVAAALGALGDPAAEDALLALLAAPEPDVVAAAAKALGQVGTTAAVPALRAAEEEAGLLSGTRGPLSDAVRAIQARATGERGGLAVADPAPEAGALSEVRARRGQLSQPE